MDQMVDLAGLVGAATKYYNSAAMQHDAGTVALIALSLFMLGAGIGLLWRLREKNKWR